MSSEQNPTASVQTRTVIDRFNEAFNRHDADALALVLTDDTVFEDTSPAPDGRRIEGKAAVVGFWRDWFTRNAEAVFEAEDVIVSGERTAVAPAWRGRLHRARRKSFREARLRQRLKIARRAVVSAPRSSQNNRNDPPTPAPTPAKMPP
jgi:ketosteroid isomerase-like protein